MRYIIDIGHPAHVHLFTPFAKIIIQNGNQILFTCRKKEFEIELLAARKFDFISLGKHYNSVLGKILGLLKFNILLFFIAMNFKPDMFISHGSIYAAHVAFLLRKPHVSMEDTGNMEQIRLYLPFTKVVLSPNELPINLGAKHIRYQSYHELAYLAPKYFKPSINILKQNKINTQKPFILFRFVKWSATHDIGQEGFTSEEKEILINELANNYNLLISSEGKTQKKYNKYLLKIRPEQIHHVIAFADLVISEGATMASEAGVLGTPSIYVNSLERCYNTDQEKYGTVFHFKNGEGVLEKAKEILEIPNNNDVFNERRQKLISDKIDLTAFLVWFIPINSLTS